MLPEQTSTRCRYDYSCTRVERDAIGRPYTACPKSSTVQSNSPQPVCHPRAAENENVWVSLISIKRILISKSPISGWLRALQYDKFRK